MSRISAPPSIHDAPELNTWTNYINSVAQTGIGQWFRSQSNENWAFDAEGLMHTRIASINDLPIAESECLYRWPAGRRPDEHPGLTELGL